LALHGMSYYPTESDPIQSAGDSQVPAQPVVDNGAAEVPKVGEFGDVGVDTGAAASIPPLSTLVQQFSRSPTQFQRHFWRHQMDLVENGFDSDGKAIDFYNLGSTPNGSSSALPLARIKKVMKNDDEVKMISAEAPILFSRACEIFIADLTCRAFMVAEENKRRTIQRSDIANAVARSDLFDFLIDIVPRSESMRNRGGSAPVRSSLPTGMAAPSFGGDMAQRVSMPEPNAGAAGFMRLRPSQQDVRQMDNVDPSLGMNPAAQAMKSMPKGPLPNDWPSSMYSFPTAPMGDARMHASAGLIPGSTQAPVASRPVMQRSGVESFMDTSAPLSMQPQQPRAPLLNMVPYSMDEHAQRADGAPGD